MNYYTNINYYWFVWYMCVYFLPNLTTDPLVQARDTF